MKGWKTWVGAIGLFCTGAGTVLAAVDFETWAFDGEKMTVGFGMIGAAFTAVGIGHKLEK